jgi:hypothetical protein
MRTVVDTDLAVEERENVVEGRRDWVEDVTSAVFVDDGKSESDAEMELVVELAEVSLAVGLADDDRLVRRLVSTCLTNVSN